MTIDVFVQTCAEAQESLLNSLCYSEELTTRDIGRRLRNFPKDESTILEISKRLAKVHTETMVPDMEVGCLRELCDILQLIVECCEENNWFGN